MTDDLRQVTHFVGDDCRFGHYDDELGRAEARLKTLEADRERAKRIEGAARGILRWDSAEAEPCWRCGGSGSYCEEAIGALETCRCCDGTGSHCRTVQSKDGTVACVEHHPKKREAECQREPELYAALASSPAAPTTAHRIAELADRIKVASPSEAAELAAEMRRLAAPAAPSGEE